MYCPIVLTNGCLLPRHPAVASRCLVSSITRHFTGALIRATQSRPSAAAIVQTSCQGHLFSIRIFHSSQGWLHYDKSLHEATLSDGDIRFFMDLKEGHAGKYVKITEKSRGKRATIMLDWDNLPMF